MFIININIYLYFILMNITNKTKLIIEGRYEVYSSNLHNKKKAMLSKTEFYRMHIINEKN